MNKISSIALVLMMTATEVMAASAQPAPKPLAGPAETTDHKVGDTPTPDRKPSAEDIAKEKGVEPTPEAAAEPVRCALEASIFDTMRPIEGENGCGIDDPIRLVGVHGDGADLAVSGNAVLSCEYAKVLERWIGEDLPKLGFQYLHEEITGVVTGPGYQCRRRNRQKTGKMSEHSYGKAIDVLAFDFGEDHPKVDVKSNWGKDTPEGKFLKAAHEAACKRFTTVLGPDADAAHQTHFHLDTGCHGKTCTYLICQ